VRGIGPAGAGLADEQYWHGRFAREPQHVTGGIIHAALQLRKIAPLDGGPGTSKFRPGTMTASAVGGGESPTDHCVTISLSIRKGA